jgi:basic amino acid/polyamine antiporter, APA family
MTSTDSPREFRRELGLLSSTMIVVGSMIGSGIFIVSADIARTVGSPGFLLLTWVITGVVTLIAAMSYGELAGMMPQAGGQYVYLREAYNPLIGFLYGWTLFMVIQSGTIAAVAVAFAKFLGVFVPALGEKAVVLTLAGRNITAAQLVAIASVLVLTLINIGGIRQGKRVQDFFTLAKIVALVALIALGFVIGRSALATDMNFSSFWTASWTKLAKGAVTSVQPLSGMMIPIAIGVAMVGSLFSSDAWNNITFTAGEVIHPKRNIPLSLAIGTGIVTLIYLLANLAYILVLPLAGAPGAADVAGRGISFAVSDRVGTAVASAIFGAPGEFIMAALIMVSTFGCNNGLILAGARVYYAMARDGLFFRQAGSLNRHAVPSWALVAQAVWTSLLCLSGTYGDLLDYVVFAVLIFYCLTIFGIFRLRRLRPDAERPYKAFGYPVLPIVYIVIAVAICLDLLVYKPEYTWPGLIIVLVGVPVYFGWRKLVSGGSV